MNTPVPKSLLARTLDTAEQRVNQLYSLCVKLSPTSVFECSQDLEDFVLFTFLNG